MKHLAEKMYFNPEERNVLLRCRKEIQTLDPTAEVILYGSRARREHAPDSDYDLLILTDREASLKQEDVFRDQIYDIELETGAVLSIMLRQKDQWHSPQYQAMPFQQNVDREGVIL
jgi:uncharacterized protein